MKRLLISGLVLLAVAGTSSSFAQGKRVYDDDIYYNSKTAKQAVTDDEEEPARQQEASAQGGSYSDNGNTYSSSGRDYDSRNNDRRSDEDDYVSLDDDYYYSTRISRFNYPFYNRPYWSSFYNPYWYDPFWVDPYWGWSPWARPGFSVSFGTGPYWSSFWGWQSWYGFGGFNSYFGYPGFGMYGGYYSGYWNGYYAGLYNNYGLSRSRPITYGPRYSLDANRNSALRGGTNIGGFRRDDRRMISGQTAEPGNFGSQRGYTPRTLNSAADRPVRDRNAAVQPESRDARNNGAESAERNAPIRSSDGFERFGRGNGSEGVNNGAVAAPRRGWANEAPARSQQAEAPVSRPERGGWFGGGRGEAPAPARTYEQPRMERSAPAPRMEMPSRSFGNGGGFGGGSRGGSFGGGSGGGGGFRGGRR